MAKDGSHHGGSGGPEDFFDDTHIVDEIIRRVVRRKGGLPPGSTCEDLRQEVLTRLFSWLRTGRKPDNLVALLTTLVKNCLVDMQRHQQAERRDSRKEVDIDDPDRGETQWLAGIDKDIRGKILLDELREKLSGPDRVIFEQVFYENRTLTDIAEERGVTKQAVSARLGRILKKFRPLV